MFMLINEMFIPLNNVFIRINKVFMIVNITFIEFKHKNVFKKKTHYYVYSCVTLFKHNKVFI